MPGFLLWKLSGLQDEDGQITMVSREQTLPYSPTILPYVISGKKQADAILLRDQSYFTDLDVRFMPDSAVVAVDPTKETVTLESGETIQYEKLLLATGADAAVPPFSGIDTVPYQVVRTLDDALKLRKSIQAAKSAIVIGAGLIAMHTAENLARAGIAVTMVVRRQVSLFAYFDGDAARMIETIFCENGVSIATGSGVASVASAGAGCKVTLESGKVLSADLLLLAAGVRPRVGFLRRFGHRQSTWVSSLMRPCARTSRISGQPGMLSRRPVFLMMARPSMPPCRMPRCRAALPVWTWWTIRP